MTNKIGRIAAFSDGIFSIAATLLVLDLKPAAYSRLSVPNAPPPPVNSFSACPRSTR